MLNVPRNVFRVCDEATSVAPVAAPAPKRVRQVSPIEYKIKVKDGIAFNLVGVSLGNVTKADLMKAAKCAKFTYFKAYSHAAAVESSRVMPADLPIAHNVYIVKANKPTAEKSKTKVFSICETTSVAPAPKKAPKKVLAKKAPAKKVRETSMNEFCIYRGSEILRICQGLITKDDLMKAAKCAKITNFRAFKNACTISKYLISPDELPIRHNVYIREKRSGTSKTKVFSICETTSTPPVRPARKVVGTATVITTTSSTIAAKNESLIRKQLVDSAITCFKNGIAALEKLASKL